jgi:D-aminoacyl-tRNA deacylase
VRAVIQRVGGASVSVEGEVLASVGTGILALVGVREDDTESDASYVAEKLVNMRIFEDDGGKMNLSVVDIGGEALIVSQFTLYGDARKGRRPSFTDAARGEHAKLLYERVCELAGQSVPVSRGVFGAEMQVSLVNDGPVTILLDSRRQF